MFLLSTDVQRVVQRPSWWRHNPRNKPSWCNQTTRSHKNSEDANGSNLQETFRKQKESTSLTRVDVKDQVCKCLIPSWKRSKKRCDNNTWDHEDTLQQSVWHAIRTLPAAFAHTNYALSLDYFLTACGRAVLVQNCCRTFTNFYFERCA